MAFLKYIGQKTSGMPVTFPIGVMNKTGMKSVRVADPYLEVSDEEAKKLLELNTYTEVHSFHRDAEGNPTDKPKDVERVLKNFRYATAEEVALLKGEAPEAEKRGPGRPKKD